MTFRLDKCYGIRRISSVLLVISMASGSIIREEDEPSRKLTTVQTSQEYLEECRTTNLQRNLYGYVNVFAFLDPSSYYSYRQAIMLGWLKKRLENSGFTNIRFFAVTSSNHASKTGMVNDVGPNYFWGAEEMLFDDHPNFNNEGIIFLRDTPGSSIWEYFRASKNEVVVIDRCGKVTYQVIVPWSMLYFPYVKAAILTTYKEDPCGPCDITPTDYDDKDDGNGNIDSHATEILTGLIMENSTASSKLEEINDTVASPNTNFNIRETNVSNITTTDLPPLEIYLNHKMFDKADRLNETTPSENVKIDDSLKDNNTLFADNGTELITEVPLLQQQTQTPIIVTNLRVTEEYNGSEDRDVNEEINGNRRDLDLRTDSETVNENYKSQDKMNDNLKSGEKMEEISRIDYTTVETNIENETDDQKHEDSLPLRITLYAPHTHRENETLKNYTHLTLKVGSPNYHGHFNSKNAIIGEQPVTSEISDDKVNKYGPNESPGIFGEVADYFRDIEEESANNDNATAKDAESDTWKPNSTEENDSDTKIVTDEDETLSQRKITEHYNKLMSWIYYLL